MQRTIAAITLLLALLLTACGGDAYTPTVPVATLTPVPVATATIAVQEPTATVAAPTNTTAPATATAIPATDTPPPAATNTTVPPAPTDVSGSDPGALSKGQLEIVDFTNFSPSQDSSSIYVVGAVKNSGDSPLTEAKVIVSATDKEGKTVATGDDFLLFTVDKLEAGQTYPFEVLLDAPNGEVEQIEVITQASPWTPDGFHYRNQLSGLDVDGAILGSGSEYSSPNYTGRVVNKSGKEATSIQILAIGYGTDGKVLETGDTYVSLDPLAAGEDAPFEITFLRTDAEIMKVDVRVVGYEK